MHHSNENMSSTQNVYYECFPPDAHLIRNNVIHVSHMFLMRLNLEECGLWWEAAMICEVCVVEGRQGDELLRGDFALLCAPDLFTYSRSLHPSCTASHLLTQTCVSNVQYLFVHKRACSICSWQRRYIYMARYLHGSQAFGPSLVPTVWPLTHGSQPILSSYRMRQCRTWGG